MNCILKTDRLLDWQIAQSNLVYLWQQEMKWRGYDAVLSCFQAALPLCSVSLHALHMTRPPTWRTWGIVQAPPPRLEPRAHSLRGGGSLAFSSHHMCIYCCGVSALHFPETSVSFGGMICFSVDEGWFVLLWSPIMSYEHLSHFPVFVLHDRCAWENELAPSSQADCPLHLQLNHDIDRINCVWRKD